MRTGHCALILVLAVVPACASVDIPVAEPPVAIEQMADALADRDVVFLGEVHDNDAGHALQARTVELLHARRRDLVVSMEMFERDTQDWLDRYLGGEVEEKEFRANARPWGNYAKHYRGVVEFAKANKLPVVAANIPRPLAAQVAKGGDDALLELRENPNIARRTTAPKNDYWVAFQAAMAEHMGNSSPEKLTRFYQSQCLKDDTMAESIARALGGPMPPAGGRRPLVVHLCGKFHSDHWRGTVARVRQRVPGARIGVVTMGVATSSRPGIYAPIDASLADYVWLVPENGTVVESPAPANSPAKSRPTSRPRS